MYQKSRACTYQKLKYHHESLKRRMKRTLLKGNKIFLFRWLTGSLIFFCFIFHFFSVKAEQSSVADLIKTFNATLIESMKRSKELGYSGRYKLLEPVIKNSFAISYMARISLGGYWKTLNEEERRLFLETYTDWSIASYAGRFNDYSGERFEDVSESKPVKGVVTVISRLTQPRNEDVEFYYQLRNIEGTWRIVDIQISGVSQLALTRSQFVSVMGKKGFHELVSILKNKINVYSRDEE
jgi:phospholipid transport system substrate-binding protein